MVDWDAVYLRDNEGSRRIAMFTKTVDRSARFVGCLLGCAFGDVLGASVEMQPRSRILARHGGLLRDFLATGRGFGCYTDDTEMTLALARSILRMGDVNAADCASA
jgi:poly(ADP-ribose) glycohydrolase ARH3